jgi:hypothetical protein
MPNLPRLDRRRQFHQTVALQLGDQEHPSGLPRHRPRGSLGQFVGVAVGPSSHNRLAA